MGCIMKFRAFFISLFLICSFQLNAQWIRQSFKPGFDLTKVKFVSENTGWILGYRGIFRTTDGGINWLASDTSSQNRYYSFYAYDKNLLFCYKIYGSSAYGVINKSTDGGITWNSVVNDLPGLYFNSFWFLNSSTGFAIGDSLSLPIIRKTTDGGTTWQTVLKLSKDNDKDGYFTSICFAGPKNGWALSFWGLVYQTTDGGNTWTLLNVLDINKNGLNTPCKSIQFTTADSGWVVGGLRSMCIILRTTDGGKTWLSSAPAQGSSLTQVNMVNSQVGYFVGNVYNFNNIAKTTDGGITWKTQTCTPDYPPGFYSISMINKNLGWIVGEKGLVYKTTNGGELTSVEETNLLPPVSCELLQNYPNPFNPSTVINYELITPEFVTLKIYDMLGRELATLVKGYQNAGLHKVDFNAAGLSAGTYIYQLNAGGKFIESKKMVFLK